MGRFKIGQEIVCRFTPIPWVSRSSGVFPGGPAQGEIVHVEAYLPIEFAGLGDYIALKEYSSLHYYNEHEFEPTVPAEVIEELFEMGTELLFI